MGLPCVSPSHVLALGLGYFGVWAVFWFVLGWDKRGGYVGWDGMRMGRYIVGKEQIAR